VEVPLDGEQSIDPSNGFERQGRDGRGCLALETGAKAVVPGLFGEQGGWLSASGRKFRPITLLVGTGSIDAVTSIPFSR
jgi:hypothetical protein